MRKRRARRAALVAVLAIGATGCAGPIAAPIAGRSVVTGVGADDMLKLRAGPGTGFRIVAGLPEGSVVVNRGCSRVGGTPWCEVELAESRGLRGYVSGHYLRDE
ncbi:SH3 domain-containing protein [Rhodovulum sp. 12E13]|uniref:SH3 domain-containing protein n=1 Tax=Rhodovulum sp. 12E13 TaxID=2203891 RepID=UPI000E11D450|nr:SH3 domain-containing protein [Rhodovulum sp. 12E13]RDC71827.1 SH3 domain-containing protein [Rhodovulum sp. 12E13]